MTVAIIGAGIGGLSLGLCLHKLNIPFQIYEAVKVKTFNFPKDLKGFDCLIVAVDHKQFKIQKKILEKYLKNCKLIIDHDGAWKKYNLKNNYHLSGDHGWI